MPLGVIDEVMSFATVEILVISFVLSDFIEVLGLSGFLTGLLGYASLIRMVAQISFGGWYADQRRRVITLT